MKKSISKESKPKKARSKFPIERVQLGVRIEKRLAKVLKGIAECADMSLGEMIEDIVLHSFEGVSTFSDPKVRAKINELKKIYNMDYDVHASYRFMEKA